ncbi:MAG: ParA family protein [Bacteriovoracaceae bacterium]|jgi:chromosome partitioning protein|nr:ParA family protein [Bacteriovoracaceae bacterium]
MLKFLAQKNNEQIQQKSQAKVIALMNQKGGVGKTTMAYNVAHALNSTGKKVLCLDMDPQFNFSMLFGQEQSDSNIHHLLINSIRELKSLHSPILISDVLVKSKTGIDLIPAGQELSGFELSVAGINAPRQLILKKFLEKNNLLERYDYIVIDGPPTLGLLVVNILCACHGVLFPFIPDSFSEQGLKNIRNVLLDIEDMGIVETPKILGYIPNLYEGRRKKAKEDFEHIRNEFNDGEVFSPFLNRAHFAKSMASKKSVFDYEAQDFKDLQLQFLQVVNSVQNQLEN